MDIRGSDIIESFCKKHADVIEPLAKWVDTVVIDIRFVGTHAEYDKIKKNIEKI